MTAICNNQKYSVILYWGLFVKIDDLLAAESLSLFFHYLFKKYRKRKPNNEKNKGGKEFEPNNWSFWETVKKEFVYRVFGGLRYDSQESIERIIVSTEQIKDLFDRKI